jgi:hypothetical protein
MGSAKTFLYSTQRMARRNWLGSTATSPANVTPLLNRVSGLRVASG